MFEFNVISKTGNGDLIVAQFRFKSDAMVFIQAMDMPKGYHRIEPIDRSWYIGSIR